jgi:hypothetical protein
LLKVDSSPAIVEQYAALCLKKEMVVVRYELLIPDGLI